MRSFLVIIVHIIVDSHTCITWFLVCLWVNILIFDCSPKPFNENVVVGPASVIHADSGTCIQKNAGVLRTGKMASLIAVHNLRRSFPEGCMAGFQNKTDFHAIADAPVKNITGVPVDNCDKIQPVCFYRDVGDIYRPYLVRMVNFKVFQKIRIYRVSRCRFTCIYPNSGCAV